MNETKQQKVFKWLISGELDFTSLVEAYTYYLKRKEKEQREIITGLSIPLIQYWEGCHLKTKKQDIFMRGKAAYYLLKGMVFHTAKIEEQLKKEAVEQL